MYTAGTDTTLSYHSLLNVTLTSNNVLRQGSMMKEKFEQSHSVTPEHIRSSQCKLREFQWRLATRCFAALSMTRMDLSGGDEPFRAFEA